MTTNAPTPTGFAALLCVNRSGRGKKAPANRRTQRAPLNPLLPPSSPPPSLPPRRPSPNAPPRPSSPAAPPCAPTPRVSSPRAPPPGQPRATTPRALPRPTSATSRTTEESVDSNVASEDQHRDKRPRTTIPCDPDVIRNFETVIKLHKQSDRIAEGVEYLYEAAQTLPRLIGTFVQYDRVLVDGLASDGKDDEDDDNDDDDDAHSGDVKWNTHWQVRYNFAVIKEYLPGFEEHAEYLRQRPDLVTKLAKWMTTVAGKARGSDITRIKASAFKIAKFTDPALQRKANRGFKHTETGRLLCPVKLLVDFDNDPEGFCRKVYNMHDDRPRVAGGDWPAFMYDMKLYIPGKLKPGFLKSQMLLDIHNSFKLVFTGPASADAPSHQTKVKGKPSISRKLQIHMVVITSIIYVAALVRFALNAQNEWADANGEWDGWDFAESIMTCMLRDTAWQEELTEWYTERVYGGVSNDTTTSSEPSAYELCIQEIEAEQRERGAVAGNVNASGSEWVMNVT
ncbi:hypothetical protein C8Q79DRAFT_1012428 [Trametes meyenii]|nr:hypothetical protein C8Q79DRAFT_1012428 [Trametes meyenii]